MRSESGGVELPPAWRLVRTAPASGAYNMAVDAALLASASDRGFGVWRTYAWDRPTISFGRNEAVSGRFSADSIAATGLDAVRRPTGGRALLHSAEVTYSVTVPIDDGTPWTSVYAAVNGVLLRALKALGVAAELVPEGATAPLRPDGPVCFDRPAPGEIVVRGAKLSGSAVWRERGAYLQHGSILLHDDQHRLQDAMRPDSRAVATDPVTATSLAACLPATPAWETVASALERALRDAVVERHSAGANVTSDDAALPDAGSIEPHAIRFRDPMWLWRR